MRLRENTWVKGTAFWLLRAGGRPNQVSASSVVFASLSGICLVVAATTAGRWAAISFAAAGAFISLRGLCNLCDGLMAIEGGLRTKSGEIFNDLPDRLSDSIVFVAAGHSLASMNWGRELGWAAALLAVMTAYVRVLGASSGASQQFGGPMAKTHRMAVMAAACLAASVEAASGHTPRAVVVALAIVVIGCVATIGRRTLRVVRELEAK
jgi:phosphatidylglycerophosphate synthase